MMAEFNKLQIKSETLDKQIELLAQPVVKLSADELALLRQPVVAISDSANPTAVKASFEMSKPAAPGAAPAAAQQPPAPGTPPTPGPNVETAFKPSVPDDLIPIARDAKENFDAGKFRASEKQYEQILAKAPNNLYALSNLGAFTSAPAA
jgi:hypothetical protein